MRLLFEIRRGIGRVSSWPVGRPARCVNCAATLYFLRLSRARDACKCTVLRPRGRAFRARARGNRVSERERSKTSGKSDGIPVIPSTKRFAPLTRTRGERERKRGRGGGRETGESRWLWQWERRKHDEFIAEIRYARIGVARRRKHPRGETSADFQPATSFVSFYRRVLFPPPLKSLWRIRRIPRESTTTVARLSRERNRIHREINGRKKKTRKSPREKLKTRLAMDSFSHFYLGPGSLSRPYVEYNARLIPR